MIYKKVFSFFQGTKIASDLAPLEPTLFPHVTVPQGRKGGSGTAALRFWGRTIIYVKSGPFTAKKGTFPISCEIPIVT